GGDGAGAVAEEGGVAGGAERQACRDPAAVPGGQRAARDRREQEAGGGGHLGDGAQPRAAGPLRPQERGERARAHERAGGAHRDGAGWPAAARSTRPSRSWPQKSISAPPRATTKVGAPKIPRRTASPVLSISRCFTSGSCVRASIASPSSPSRSTTARRTAGSSRSWPEAHMARNIARLSSA